MNPSESLFICLVFVALAFLILGVRVLETYYGWSL